MRRAVALQAAAPAAPACTVCTTPHRCRTPVLGRKGANCAGKADGPDDCDCLHGCGSCPWLADGRSKPCSEFKARQARDALLMRQAQAQPLLLALARRVAALNPASATIGAGMLASLVSDAKAAVEPFSGSAS